MGFDNLILSHKRQQSRILNMQLRQRTGSQGSLASCVVIPMRNAYMIARDLYKQSTTSVCGRRFCYVGLREKSPGTSLGDESPPEMRVDCRI